jgi:hypothetical protein
VPRKYTFSFSPTRTQYVFSLLASVMTRVFTADPAGAALWHPGPRPLLELAALAGLGVLAGLAVGTADF